MNQHKLINIQDSLCKEIQEIRDELEQINICLSLPQSDFELRYVQQEIFKKYSQKSNELITVNDQIQKMTKEKSTVRQESTFRNKTNH